MQLFIGFIAEGSTDYKFLEPILTRVFIEIAFECQGQIDISVSRIDAPKGDSFIDSVINASTVGWNQYGISILVVHADADSTSAENTYNYKIFPAKARLESKSEDSHCKNLIPLVPIQEIESWMLSDKEFLKSAINTKKSDTQLSISGHPESFTDPKARIENAILIGREDMPKKVRESVSISDLYSLIGQGLDLKHLETFTSYNDFKDQVRSSFRTLNLLV